MLSIPYLEYSNTELKSIEQFVDDGGTLLLMDDYGYGNSLLEYLDLDVRFSNRPLLDPLFCFKNQRMPKITDFSTEVQENNINIMVLNHATTLANTVDVEVIAWSSDTSFLDMNEED